MILDISISHNFVYKIAYNEVDITGNSVLLKT
jgi:hypothetical protein